AAGLAAPGTIADDIDIMSTTERHQVLHTWSSTAVAPRDEGHAVVADVVRASGLLHQVTAGHDPGRVAFRFH
ncbi:hypothetical protein ACLQ2R_39770, partial [Streptosporangium sp. DT93]|uniref:hypothetical protein n=1 Tax=Streptosporangium sp. DT93 TaxID=3393428 RepID=UPI003CF2F1C8